MRRPSSDQAPTYSRVYADGKVTNQPQTSTQASVMWGRTSFCCCACEQVSYGLPLTEETGAYFERLHSRQIPIKFLCHKSSCHDKVAAIHERIDRTPVWQSYLQSWQCCKNENCTSEDGRRVGVAFYEMGQAHINTSCKDCQTSRGQYST